MRTRRVGSLFLPRIGAFVGEPELASLHFVASAHDEFALAGITGRAKPYFECGTKVMV